MYVIFASHFFCITLYYTLTIITLKITIVATQFVEWKKCPFKRVKFVEKIVILWCEIFRIIKGFVFLIKAKSGRGGIRGGSGERRGVGRGHSPSKPSPAYPSIITCFVSICSWETLSCYLERTELIINYFFKEFLSAAMSYCFHHKYFTKMTYVNFAANSQIHCQRIDQETCASFSELWTSTASRLRSTTWSWTHHPLISGR